MLLAFALILISLTLTIAPRLLVRIIATMIGIALVRRSRRLEQALLRTSADHRLQLDYDRPPSRPARRLMRAHLRLAIRQTELASLLPGVMEQVRSLADR
ncbi:MAG: hypothetical protein ABI240_08850 [Sphingomonas sp.]